MLQLYYTTLEKNEKQDLIDLIGIKCQCRPSTASAWVYGTRTPFPLAQQAIADIIGISRDKLFPVTDSKGKISKNLMSKFMNEHVLVQGLNLEKFRQE